MIHRYDHGWRSRLPFILILVSLVGMAVLPILVTREIDRHRAVIVETTNPALAHLRRIELELALETAGTRGYLLTGDERYAAGHVRARAARTQAMARLLPLTRRLSPECHAAALRLADQLAMVDARLDSLYAGLLTRPEYVERLEGQQGRLQTTFDLANRLHTTIEATAARHRSRVESAESAGMVVGMVLLALLASVLAVRLGRSYRALAERLDVRMRRQAALRSIAGQLATTPDVRAATRVLATHAVAIADATAAFVEWADVPEPGNETEVVAAAGPGCPPVGTRVAYPGSLTDTIIESGEPALASEPGAIGQRMATHLEQSCPGCSALVVPLITEGRARGALILLREPGRRNFTPEDVADARILGDLAAAALGRTALLAALSESESRFRQIADHLDQVIWLGAPDLSAHYYVNPAYERIWGRSIESFYARPRSPVEAIHPEDRARVEVELEGLRRGEFDTEFRIIRPDGQIRWIRSRGYPIRNEQGEVVRVAGIMEDITEQQAAEAERDALLGAEREARGEAEQRRAEVERITESRARLMRGFSHDVKNPLGAADGYLQLLEEGIMGEISDAQRESIAKARRSIATALGLLQDLLAIARAETGDIEVTPAPTNIPAVAAEAAETYRAQAEAKGLSLSIETPADIPAIQSDAGRIRQVLGNLLSNGVKYTDEGSVTVRTTVRENGDAPGPGRWIAIDVTDTGPGIPESQLPTIFQEFGRLDSTGQKHGTGIGLAIAMRIARALDSTITVRSQLGQGSTFTLWLPFRTAAGEAPAGQDRAAD